MKKTEHQLFRRSKAWQNFRKEMLNTHPYCAFCHSNRATRTVHHIFNCQTEEEYEDLTPSRFIILCSHCHTYLHWIGRKKSDSTAVREIKKIALSIGFGEDWVKFYDNSTKC